jgi:hypothetical protein
MTGGRELDALVAERVMGLQVQRDQYTAGVKALLGDKRSDDPWDYYIGDTNDRLPHYSTDISAAWLVVERMRQTHDFELGLLAKFKNGKDLWEAEFTDCATDEAYKSYLAEADTAPLAICLAALAALQAVGG